MSIWNVDVIRDVAESIGLSNLSREVVDNLARDVEYRIGLILEEALKFMRHANRTTLTTRDVTLALRVLDVEPLYGYETSRPLRFGEAMFGPGQSLFYVEDDEVDFEKLINAPLPKIPRDITLTAHWLAIEGVQPSIPQNPLVSSGNRGISVSTAVTTTPNNNNGLGSSGSGIANTTLNNSAPISDAIAGIDSNRIKVKPIVKHVLSREIQLYFERVCTAVLDRTNEEFRNAAFASLKADPGLQQLLCYFVQFIAEQVTHNLNDIFILTQMNHVVEALIQNSFAYLDPVIPSLVAPIFTCLVAKKLGDSHVDPSSLSHLELRDLAASILSKIAKKYGPRNRTLKARIARSCLKNWLDPSKSLGTHYGAITGLVNLGGCEVIENIILPNLTVYDMVLREAVKDPDRLNEAEMVTLLLVKSLTLLESDAYTLSQTRSKESLTITPEDESTSNLLTQKIGSVLSKKLIQLAKFNLISIILKIDTSFPPSNLDANSPSH